MSTPATVPDKNDAPIAIGDLVVTPFSGIVKVREIVEHPTARGGYKLRYRIFGRDEEIHPCHVVKAPR